MDEEKLQEIGVYDAHCHPTDIMSSIKDIANMNAHALIVMATRSQDQNLVADAARRYLISSRDELSTSASKYVIPSFGWHPWFSYQMYDDRHSDRMPTAAEHYRAVLTSEPDDTFIRSLPDPLSLSEFLEGTKKRLEEFPLALVGEIGLDRSFRLPKGEFKGPGDTSSKTDDSKEEYTPGSREGRPLSPHRVSLDHQKTVLHAQLELAAKLQRAVSIHSVQAHGVVFDLLHSMWKGYENKSKRHQKRHKDAPQSHAADKDDDKNTASTSLPKTPPFPPRICMHSYSGPPDALRQFLNPTVPAQIYFSFSSVINFSTPSAAKVTSVIETIPDDRILIESDFHCAGDKMDRLLEEIVSKVCEIKGWKLEDGAKQLKANWERFVFG